MAKAKKAKTFYSNEAGEQSAHWRPGFDALTFAFEGGATYTIKAGDFPADIIPGMTLHGAGQKLRDTYAGDESVADAEESFTTMLERLKSGEWVTERTGLGPSPVLLIEAIKAAKAKAGQPFDEATAKEKYKTKEAREKALSVPVVKAEYERLRAERQAAKAAAAAKAAEGGGGNLADI